MRNNPAWREGYVAYDESLMLSDNPYSGDDTNSVMWHDGWLVAQEDANPIDGG